jgi:hypothetical protein
MTYPNITFYDAVANTEVTREMTPEEYADWEATVAQFPPMPEVTDETPSPA